jgi:hypothetical protein
MLGHVNAEQSLPLEIRPVKEIQLDFLVALELATGSTAGQLLWQRIQEAPPDHPPIVDRQTRRIDDRTTDVEATNNEGQQPLRLLIEDKVSGGHFEPGQVESYCEEQARDRAFGKNTKIGLVAPQAFIDGHLSDANRFDAAVSIEDLAASLERGARDTPESELAANYRYRAGLLSE